MWWADGLWDFAMAGFFALTAYWGYVWIRVEAFPTWTWPWPFITDEVVNPLRGEIWLWIAAILPACALYTWSAFKIVQALKTRWIAPHTGHVRFRFWMRVERRVYLAHVAWYVVSLALLVGLCSLLKGGPHVMSAIFIVAPVGILFIIGWVYRLPRYRWVAAAGLVVGAALELLATTHADYMKGPANFFDVSPLYGNPALPFVVWAIILIASGAIALARTLRGHGDGQ
jgi:hypothetical protein